MAAYQPASPSADDRLGEGGTRLSGWLLNLWLGHGRILGKGFREGPATGRLQYVTAEWEPAFLRPGQAREFPFFPLLPREASK